ncbi:MAG: hypothetical protein FD130_2500, partial [Halothiobacillaceae bacterium]
MARTGGLSLSSAVGVYGGIWTSSESGGQETDLYVGYAGKAGGFGYDISYVSYQYPEDGTYPDDGLSDQDFADVILSGSYGPVTLAAYLQTEAPKNAATTEDENNYFTISGKLDAFTLTYGFWDLETAGSGTTGMDEYSHLTLMYAATSEVSVGVS